MPAPPPDPGLGTVRAAGQVVVVHLAEIIKQALEERLKEIRRECQEEQKCHLEVHKPRPGVVLTGLEGLLRVHEELPLDEVCEIPGLGDVQPHRHGPAHDEEQDDDGHGHGQTCRGAAS